MVRICMEYWRSLWFVGLRRDFLKTEKNQQQQQQNVYTSLYLYIYKTHNRHVVVFYFGFDFCIGINGVTDGITRCFRLILHLPLTPTCFLLFSVKYTFIPGKIFYYIMETIRGKNIEGMLMWYEILFLFSLRLPISIL